MISASERLTVIERERIAGAIFDVVRYESLQGLDDDKLTLPYGVSPLSHNTGALGTDTR